MTQSRMLVGKSHKPWVLWCLDGDGSPLRIATGTLLACREEYDRRKSEGGYTGLVICQAGKPYPQGASRG